MTRKQKKSNGNFSVPGKNRPLLWEPKTKAQLWALNSRAEILLFGGAAGSLKTETLVMDAVREADNPNLNAIIFRESYPQVADILRKCRRLLSGSWYWAKYISNEHAFIFPRNLSAMRAVALRNDQRGKGEAPLPMPEPIYDRGATLKLGYLGSDEDCAQHDGQEYSFIGFDESTHHTDSQIRYLLSRLRSTDPSLFLRMRLASNPGNIGHAWHMKVFIGEECPHCRPNSDRIRKPFTVYDDAVFPDGTPVNHTTEFVPGLVTDHAFFADLHNPEAGNEPYIRRLRLQKPAFAKALAEGCWGLFQGQYFTCWDESRGQDVLEGYREPDLRMVIPFAQAPVKYWHHHFLGIDWGVGSSQAASVLCVRTPPDAYFRNGRIYVLKELALPESNLDEYAAEFLRHLVIPDLEGNRRKIEATFMGPDSWNDYGHGHSIASQFQERVEEYGINLIPASTDRVGGWQLIYRMLNSGELVICGDTCPQLVAAIPTRLHNLKRPGDILKRPGDHADDIVDALRYAVYSFINGSEIRKPRKIRMAERLKDLDATSAVMLQIKMAHTETMDDDDDDEPWGYRGNPTMWLRGLRNRSRRRI
jgi:terminase large subunit-like protein